MGELNTVHSVNYLFKNPKAGITMIILFLTTTFSIWLNMMHHSLFHTIIEFSISFIALSIGIIAIQHFYIYKKNKYLLSVGILYGISGLINSSYYFLSGSMNILVGAAKINCSLFSILPLIISSLSACIWYILTIKYNKNAITPVWRPAHFKSTHFNLIASVIAAITAGIFRVIVIDYYYLSNTLYHLCKLFTFCFIYKAVMDFFIAIPHKQALYQIEMDSCKIQQLESTICQLRKENALSKDAEKRASRLARLYSVLKNINQAIVFSDDPQILSEQTCRIAVEDGLFKLAWIGLSAPDSIQPIAVFGVEGDILDSLQACVYHMIMCDNKISPTNQKNTYVIQNDIINACKDAPCYSEALKRDYRSVASFPIKLQGSSIYWMTFYSGESQFFKQEEIRLLKCLIDDISFALESMERDKKAAQDRELLQEALELDKLRNEFFANVSHELKTPINVILSSLQLIELYSKKAQLLPSVIDNKIINSSKYVNIMKQNCYRLIRLVNNLVDSTKIDSGFLTPNLQNLNIVDVVKEVSLSVAHYIENKGFALEFESNAMEKITACDPDKIERIILNLLSNAVKFTNPGGKITVNVNVQENQVVISVKDTGIGIPEDKLEAIFERFRQVDKSLSRNYEGSGIGLSLVKSLVEMHNGKIYAKSRQDEGSEFIIELPVFLVPQENIPVQNLIIDNSQGVIDKINIEFSDIYH